MQNKIVWISGVFLIFFMSCEKDVIDDEIPSISIVSPVKGQFYSVGDTIYIQGKVTDNNSVQNISIALNDDNNIATGNTINLTVNSSDYVINEMLVLENHQMTSGLYNLTVRANDGTNSISKYIELNISEYPKKRNGFILFSNNGGSTSVTKLDSLLNVSQLYSVSGDFLGGVVNDKNQEVISCGFLSGNLQAYNLEISFPNWNILNNAAGQAHFTGIFKYNNQIYIAYFNQNIQSYLKSGIPNYSSQAIPNFYAENMIVHNNQLLITEQKHKTISETRIVAYYLATGIEKQNVVINEDVVQSYTYSPNEVVVFSNAIGNGNIKIFDINQNSLWQPFNLNSGLIEDCTEISLGQYIIIQNGDLILVDYINYTKSTYLIGVNAEKVEYDYLNNQLIIVSGNELSIYDYPSKTKMTSYINSEAISDFDIWYNK